MTNEIVIKDKNNLTIGWCRDLGTIVNAIHIRKGYVGYYNKSANITFTAKGAIYCYGDGTSSLIRDIENSL